jgi:cytochrome c oxidase assembly protein subunit 15
MAHFLLSIVLVAISVKIHDYFKNGKNLNDLSTLVDNYIKTITFIGFVVIVLGTITTGAGPHSGDEIAARFDLDIRVAAWLHADSVLLFLGLLIGLRIISQVDAKSKQLKQTANALLLISVVQGVIGYSQWFANLPWLLVSFHVLGAVITWIWIVKLSLFSGNSFLKRLK